VNASATDAQVRLAAFQWLREQIDAHGDVLPWKLLAEGFELSGARVPLLSQQGIFKPKVLREAPLSIRTAPDHPYPDAFGTDGLLRYAYRGTDPRHRDNVGLRKAMADRTPLVYFHGIVEGKYLVAFPVFIVGDDPTSLCFTVALDDASHVSEGLGRVAGGPADDVLIPRPSSSRPQLDEDLAAPTRRAYMTAALRVRVHQRAFRQRVLAAYHTQCALCRLRHDELLDAAHIDPDSSLEGEPVVSNGLALCKLHHAAFDRYFLTVRPDHVVEVRRAILEEEDGPMLLHGLKELHGARILLPSQRRHWPDPTRLERRWEKFRLGTIHGLA